MKLSSSNIKKYLTFSQKNAFPIFQGTETPKKFFIFQEMKVSYISGGTYKARKPKFLIFLQKPL